MSGKYLGCELQFTDGPEAYYHRFSADVIARSIELYLAGMPDQAGMSYQEVAAEVRRQFSIPSDRLKEKTVFQWVKTYINVAAEGVRELTVDSLESLSVEFASLFPADGGCWVVQDPITSYVLAAEVDDLFDPHTASITTTVQGGTRLEWRRAAWRLA